MRPKVKIFRAVRDLRLSTSLSDEGRISKACCFLKYGCVCEALARQAPCCQLLHSWLAQSNPGWSARACTKRAQSAIDGANGLVWPEPKIPRGGRHKVCFFYEKIVPLAKGRGFAFRSSSLRLFMQNQNKPAWTKIDQVEISHAD